MSDPGLRITEIFHSLQGEARSIGLPTVFVRLTGCPLRCQYCDSEYAFHGGERSTVNSVLEQVDSYGAKHVCVTGGEPLAQPNAIALIRALCDEGYEVSLETSGAMPVEDVDARVSIVMDLKTPGSQESHRNRWENLASLQQKDQIKFVICSKDDFDWAVFKIQEHELLARVGDVLVSPSFGQVEPAALADWVLKSGLPLRFQVQIHKVLWGDKPGV